jgi:hypothetical protein
MEAGNEQWISLRAGPDRHLVLSLDPGLSVQEGAQPP